MAEKWKAIAGFKGYYVSSRGRVKSFLAMGRYGTVKKWRFVTPWKDEDGRRRVGLRQDGQTFKHRVSVLVLTMFKGPALDGFMCRHLNGNASDDRIENLEWGTASANQFDRVRHGTSNRGERCGANKLSETDVKRILILAGQGVSDSKIARIIGHSIGASAVYHIRNGSTWGWFTGIKRKESV